MASKSSTGASRRPLTLTPSLDELLRDIPTEKLDRPCTDAHLCEIALYVTKWRTVASFLGLTNAEEEEIEGDYSGIMKQRIEMLRRWRGKFGLRATYRRLAKVFHKMGKLDLVDTLCGLLQASQSTSSSELNDDVQKLEVTTHKTAFAAYTKYLRGRYQTENPEFLTLQWPPTPSRKIFNLVMIKGSIDEEYVQMTVRGMVDDIMERKTPVTVEDMFRLDTAERKLILIEGAPGAGKSTLAWHIPQKWARGELFQEFEVVVFIQLSDPEVQAARSLADLLPAENRPAAEKMASEVCTSRGQSVLFILDSWDEFSPQLQPGSVFEQLICYPHKLNLHLSAVLITSRPIASGVLQHQISSRIQLVGFTPTERREYFTDALQGDTQKVKRLQDCLSERPVIEASCYLPLNAAIVVYLFRALDQTLPNTLHAIFMTLVVFLLFRHLQKEGKEVGRLIPDFLRFEDLPANIQQPLKNICTLAYHGVIKNKVTFSASDLQSFILPTELSTLSLIQGVESFTAIGKMKKSYNFLHLSIQELLAAFHISKLPESEQIHIFKELFGQPRFAAVLQHYAAFTKLQGEGIRDVLANIVKWKSKILLVSLLHCLYEAQDLSLCQFVASQLDGELNLVNTSLSPVDCLAVGYFLRSVCLITSGKFKVKLGNCSFDDNGVSFLVRGLSKPSSSSDALSIAATDGGVPGCLDLDLRDNKIHGHGAKLISELLSQCSLIRKLNLGSKKLQKEEDGLRHLLQALLTNSSLVHLSLHYCSLTITEDHGPVLAQMLQTNKTLTSLDLSENNVSDVGAFYLAEGLKQNTGLEELSARSCRITGKGAQFLSEALIVNTSLVTLDIHRNNLGDDGVAHISHSLTLNTTLRTLYLTECKLTEKGSGLLHVAQALKVNKSLRVLSVKGNSISDTGATHITNVLKYNQSLKWLNVGKCGLRNQGVELLARALATNSTLEQLDISQNDFTDTGLVALGECLKNNKGLQGMGLQWLNRVTEKGLKQFMTCLQENCHLTELWLLMTAGGAMTVQRETDMVNETRKQKGLPKLTLYDTLI